jgi:NAD(P)-dependent dehydrogenase (short-subunit alcohol dehydrogenase family)
MKLENRVAIITGAGRGIGKGIAQCLAEEGADIIVVSRTLSEVEKVADEAKKLGHKALAMRVDVTQSAQVDELVKNTMNTFGKIDVLVNNVGGSEKAPGSGGVISTRGSGINSLSDEEWDGAYKVNLKSVVNLCKAVAPHMKTRKSGKIINISSVAGKIGDNMRMPYSCMKGAVIIFTRTLAREMAKYNVNVNCICPGMIYTPLWERDVEVLCQIDPQYQGLKDPKEIFLSLTKRSALGREQTAEDVGRMVVFLASEDARNITGQSINVDAGSVME